GEHGTAVMLARGEFELDAPVESDTRPLWPAVDALLDAAGPSLRAMRDATRGGVATVLNELARGAGVAIVAAEARVPVQPEVADGDGHVGVASYELLRRIAERAGDGDTVDAVDRILVNERQAVEKLGASYDLALQAAGVVHA